MLLRGCRGSSLKNIFSRNLDHWNVMLCAIKRMGQPNDQATRQQHALFAYRYVLCILRSTSSRHKGGNGGPTKVSSITSGSIYPDSGLTIAILRDVSLLFAARNLAQKVLHTFCLMARVREVTAPLGCAHDMAFTMQLASRCPVHHLNRCE